MHAHAEAVVFDGRRKIVKIQSKPVGVLMGGIVVLLTVTLHRVGQTFTFMDGYKSLIQEHL